MQKKSQRLNLLALSIAAALSSAASYADAPAASSGDLGEIVVTARARAEKLIDVPASVQAFTASDIKSAGITRPGDFVALTPGVSQVQTAEVGDLQLSIRGLNTGRDAETNVALVVDGVLQTNPNAFNQELANLTQIEVLKGPQSAIYGRNAVAGAIIMTTKKPTDVLEGDVSATYGDHNTQAASLWIGGPVSSVIDAGIGAFYRSTDGFFYNSFLRSDNSADYYEEYGATPRVIFKLGDSGTLDLKAKYSHITAGAINFNAAFALPGFVNAPGIGSPNWWENVNQHQFQYINNIRPVNEQENKQISLKGEWQLDVGTLTAWAAYNDQSNYFLTDGTSAAFGLYNRTPGCIDDLANGVGNPLPSPTFNFGSPAAAVLPPYSPTRCDGYQYQQRDQIDSSVEIRLSSPNNQAFRWQGGVYYADIHRHVVVAQGGDQGLGLQAQAFVPSTGPNPTDLLYNDRFESKVSAVFGSIAYDITKDFEAALALRYDSEKRSVDNGVPTGAGAFAQTPLFGYGATAPYINPAYSVDPALAVSGIPSRSKTYDQLQPKLSLNWKFTDGWSAFGSYGYGFRSGGFNSTGSAATVQSYLGALKYIDPTTGKPSATPAISGVSDDFKKELSKAAEVGVKAELLDNSLFLSLAAYHTKVDDMQIFNFFVGPFGLLRVVTNVDEATLQGFEGDVRWKANRYMTFFAGFGTVDSKIDAYAGRPYTVGNKVPYAPTYTGDAGVDFRVPLDTTAGINLTAHLDANTVGPTWFSPVQDNQVQTEFGAPGDYSKTRRDAYTLANARLGIEGAHWNLTGWARNLFNRQTLAEVIPAPEFGGSFLNQGTGRALGIDFAYRFGGEAPVQAAKAAPAPVAPVVVAAAPVVAAAVPAPAPAKELDTDGDGVPDSMDQCPDTPHGVKVDAHGCPCELTAELRFSTASATLSADDKTKLDWIVGQLKRMDWTSGVIEGHTDNVGKKAYNQKLSERRAVAVREYLASEGVSTKRITVEGFGESKPVADNSTADGRAHNRRVVLRRTDCTK